MQKKQKILSLLKNAGDLQIPPNRYEIVPVGLFSIIRNCPGCGDKSIYKNTESIRVNANGKKIDVWLIFYCCKCKKTYNLPIHSRISKDSFGALEFEALQKSDREAVKKYGMDRTIFLKNGAKIYSEPPYILRKRDDYNEENTLVFSNPHKLKIRKDKLIAECLGIPRTQVQNLIKLGKINKIGDSEIDLIFKVDAS